MNDEFLAATRLLDFGNPHLERLVEARGWRRLSDHERIGAVYDFVRNEIAFGYNARDDLAASRVLRDGYGQCNTKATLLMALLRAVGVACRLRAFTVDKSLQRGIVPEIVYRIAPARILHTWVEVWHAERWVALEGVIVDAPMLAVLQAQFPSRPDLCAFGVATDCLQAPPVDWRGGDTFIQKAAITGDLGAFAAPDLVYEKPGQDLPPLKALLYRHLVRHWMNARVARLRRGIVPEIPRPGGHAAAPGANGARQREAAS